MAYELTLIEKPTYLHVIVTGSNSKQTVAGYLEAVARECAARRYDRLLIKERLEGPRLRILDVFEIVSAGAGRARESVKTIAYVDVNAKGDLMEFARTVASNRGVPVAVFPTVGDAEAWLLGSAPGGPSTPPASGPC